MRRIPKISLVDKNIDESTYFYRDMEMARSIIDDDTIKNSHSKKNKKLKKQKWVYNTLIFVLLSSK